MTTSMASSTRPTSPVRSRSPHGSPIPTGQPAPPTPGAEPSASPTSELTDALRNLSSQITEMRSSQTSFQNDCSKAIQSSVDALGAKFSSQISSVQESNRAIEARLAFWEEKISALEKAPPPPFPAPYVPPASTSSPTPETFNMAIDDCHASVDPSEAKKARSDSSPPKEVVTFGSGNSGATSSHLFSDPPPPTRSFSAGRLRMKSQDLQENPNSSGPPTSLWLRGFPMIRPEECRTHWKGFVKECIADFHETPEVFFPSDLVLMVIGSILPPIRMPKLSRPCKKRGIRL